MTQNNTRGWNDPGARGQSHRTTEDRSQRLCRAEALAYMPILRTNHVVQGFIPAVAGRRKKTVKVTTFNQDLAVVCGRDING